MPGRKTDVSDSQWLATLARYGLVNPSFVAPPRLEDLRRLTRLYARTRRVSSTLRNMLHRMLDESGLRIGGILTDLFGRSGRNLLDGLVAGQDPEQMVAGVKGKARWLKMLRQANLLQEVAKAAAKQLRGAPDETGAGPPPSLGGAPEPLPA